MSAHDDIEPQEEEHEEWDEGAEERRKHRKRRPRDDDPNRPRLPHTGYLRFLLEQREQVARDNPHLSLPEVTKAVAARWRAATPEQRQPYLDAAEADRRRYNEDMRVYNERVAAAKKDGTYTPSAPAPKRKAAIANPHVYNTSSPMLAPHHHQHPHTPGVGSAGGSGAATPAAAAVSTSKTPHLSAHPAHTHTAETRTAASAAQAVVDEALKQDPNLDMDNMLCKVCSQYFSSVHNVREHVQGRRHRLMIGQPIPDDPLPSIPIFTEEFIRHNRMREQELRELRRAIAQFEEQNRSLGQANNKLRETLQKLDEDAAQIKNENTLLQSSLTSVQDMIVAIFGQLPLPDTLGGGVPTRDNVDDYLAKLSHLFASGPQDPALVQKVHSLLTLLLQQSAAMQQQQQNEPLHPDQMQAVPQPMRA